MSATGEGTQHWSPATLTYPPRRGAGAARHAQAVPGHIRTANSADGAARRLRGLTTRLRLAVALRDTVLDNIESPVMLLDLNGHIVMANAAWSRLAGRRADQVRGRSWWDVLVVPDDRARYAQRFAAAVGQARGGGAERTEPFEADWINAESHLRTRVRYVQTALRDDTGRLTRMLVTGTDVTEQRRTGWLLSHTLSAATEHSIIATDGSGVITVFNVGAQRLLGYRPDEVVGRCTPEPFHLPEEVAAAGAQLGVEPGFGVFAAIATSGITDTGRWTYVRKDGSHVRVHLTISAIYDDGGQIVGYLGIAQDTTAQDEAESRLRLAYELERTYAERMRDLNRAKNDFIAGISHDLRSPLTSIICQHELLMQHEQTTQEMRDLLRRAQRNARRVGSLVTDLLSLAKLESDGTHLERRAQPLAPIVSGAREALAGALADRDLTVTTDPLDGIVVCAAAEHLERALTNLLSNAVKFTPDGGTIRVSAQDKGDAVSISVTDTGVGIDHDELPKVFDRFYRGRVTHGKANGSGLGLAIVKAVVEAHGGTITVASVPGAGTTFTFTIPHEPSPHLPGLVQVTSADIHRALERALVPDLESAWPALLSRAGLRGDENDPAAIERVIGLLTQEPGTRLAGLSMGIRARTPHPLNGYDPLPAPAADALARFVAPLGAPARMAALNRYDLTNPDLRRQLDDICRRTAQQLRMPSSMVSILLDGAQYFAGGYGLTGWIDDVRGTPAEWAFCAHALLSGSPVYVVSDARNHPSHRTSPLVTVEGTQAYAGAQIVEPSGQVLGMHCVVSREPVAFSDRDVIALRRAARESAAALESYRTDRATPAAAR